MALVYLSQNFLLTFKGCWGNHTLSTSLLTNGNQKLKDVRIQGKSGNAGSYENVNGDGYIDLVVQIQDDGVYEVGESIGVITAETWSGELIGGQDSICITQD